MGSSKYYRQFIRRRHVSILSPQSRRDTFVCHDALTVTTEVAGRMVGIAPRIRTASDEAALCSSADHSEYSVVSTKTICRKMQQLLKTATTSLICVYEGKKPPTEICRRRNKIVANIFRDTLAVNWSDVLSTCPKICRISLQRCRQQLGETDIMEQEISASFSSRRRVIAWKSGKCSQSSYSSDDHIR